MENKDKKIEKKKTTSRKTPAKKKTTKSSNLNEKKITSKTSRKRTIKKENIKKENIKKESNKVNILLQAIFFILLIVVVVLGILVVKKDNENKNKVVANIVVPVFEKDNQSSITINADALTSDYIVKVTNYKSIDNVNKEEFTYDVSIQNNTSANVIVKKGKNGKNLMKDSKSTIISGEKLKKSVKENVYYYISVDNINKVKSKEKILFKILS
ncbi:MAG: hypothetical protein PUG33_00025 [Mollicutes bacterium]|nr:hypothetical protein [Mollicutes bacterium]